MVCLTSDSGSNIVSATQQIQCTFSHPMQPDTESDPLAWWQSLEQNLPILSTLARKYLCICATSTASERLFSASGNVVVPKRSSLKPEMVY